MRADALDFARGVEKQLDEYRELLENIEAATGYFSSDNGEFSIGHAAMLDDYLCHIYTLRHDVKPNEAKPITYLRQKPLFIDKLKAPQASPSS
ncbi:hypothetical protein [Aliivibrio salmonicida]|uniref:hypothetical protein n=1 Tax=Aliivibrio salmonicida TaxID=40269 RepID=UPI003D151985